MYKNKTLHNELTNATDIAVAAQKCNNQRNVISLGTKSCPRAYSLGSFNFLPFPNATEPYAILTIFGKIGGKPPFRAGGFENKAAPNALCGTPFLNSADAQRLIRSVGVPKKIFAAHASQGGNRKFIRTRDF